MKYKILHHKKGFEKITIFQSIAEAEQHLKINEYFIRKVLRRIVPDYKGHIFTYDVMPVIDEKKQKHLAQMRKYQEKKRAEKKLSKEKENKGCHDIPKALKEPAYIKEERKMKEDFEKHKIYIEELKREEEIMSRSKRIIGDIDSYYNLA